jgi:membrane protease YdiL (CAAX protease family)
VDSPAYHAAPLPPAPPAETDTHGVPVTPAALDASASPAPHGLPALDPAVEGRRLLRTAAGFYGITVLFALGYAVFSGTITTVFGEQSPAAGSVLAAVVIGFAIVGLCRLGDHTVPAVRRASDALAKLLGPFDWKAAIALALVSGVAEELLFRGALWPHLGLIGTTLLFGLVHVIPRRSLLLYPLFATGAGLVLGFLRQGSGSVAPPMIAHALVNGINLWVLSRRRAPTVAPTP